MNRSKLISPLWLAEILFSLLVAVLSLGCELHQPEDSDGNDPTIVDTVDPDAQPDPIVYSGSLFERYVEQYDASIGPLETWLYDADNVLVEYSVFGYIDGLITEVLIYDTADAVDTSSPIAKLVYEYDEEGNVIYGEVQYDTDGVLTKEGYFTATYNDAGYYLEYLEWDGTDEVIEYRVATYDETGENYLTETWYADEAATIKLEEYICTYDQVEPWKWIREDHEVALTTESADSTYEYTTYTQQMYYTFTWNDDAMYLQSDFDGSGNFIQGIFYTFVDGDPYMPKTRTCIDQDGTIFFFREYRYDDDGFLVELHYYNHENPDGEELEMRQTFRLYTTADGDTLYEETTSIYDYTSRSLAGRATVPPRVRLDAPGCAHRHKSVSNPPQ